MSEIEKPFLKRVFVYSLFNSLTKFLPFLLIPIMTAYLTPEEYGQLGLFAVTVNLMFITISFNSTAIINIDYFKESPSAFKLTLMSCIQVSSTILCITSIVMMLTSKYFSKIFGIDEALINLAVFVAYFQVLLEIRQKIWISREKVWTFGFVNASLTSLTFALTCVTIILWELGLWGRVASISLPVLLLGLYSYISLKNTYALNSYAGREKVGNTIRFGWSMFPQSIANWGKMGIDKLFLGWFLTIEDVGVYTVAFGLGGVVMVLSQAINNSFLPMSMGALSSNEPNKIRKMKKAAHLSILALILGVTVFYILLYYLAPLVIDKRFQESSGLILPILIGFALHGVYLLAIKPILYHRKMGLLGMANLALLALYAVYLWPLINEMGMMGAAVGFMVKPRATAFWNAVVEWSHSIAASLRVFYTGNGQTYALFVLMYFIAIFVFNGGLSL